MPRYIFFPVILILMVITASGCASKKRLSYFDDIVEYQEGTMGSLNDYKLKLKPEDELMISVSSLDPKATADYNLPFVNPALANATGLSSTPQQQTYIVNPLGDINFPVLGKIHVAGMTTQQLAEYLTGRISERVIDPVVNVSLVNFKVSVMGEVKNPGQIPAENERLSVLDALVAAGDLTTYGERENVLVIREIDGKKVYGRLNLKDSKIVESPFFYLQQNDVVYVTPNSVGESNAIYNTNNAFKLTVISSIVSALSVVTSLIIAFSR